MKYLLILTLASLPLTGCGEDAETPLTQCSVLEATVTLVAGAPPVFSWRGGDISYLSVSDQGDHAFWQLRSPGEENLVPPVTYGNVGASNGSEDSPALPLMSGAPYTVLVSQSCSVDYDDGDMSNDGQAEARFTMP